MGVFKTKSGKVAKLLDRERGTLEEGDGIAQLDLNAWYEIVSKADTGSVLPFDEGAIFKTGGTTALTPVVGDDVYPITWNQICKVDVSLDTAKGTIDVTDDCAEGYNSYITDGFTDISGSAGGFFKFDDEDGSMPPTQRKYLGKFMSLSTDDGDGVYTETEIDDEDIFISILQNSDQQDEGDKQQWILIPAILSGLNLGKALKSGQAFDFNFQKGTGAKATVYTRTTNATETVL